jgi:RNA-directed DNA polymerase
MTDLYTLLGYDKADLELIVQNLSRYYITYKIRKRNGRSRRIDAPQDPLKAIQKQIVERVLYKFKAHPVAHGFVHGRSPKTNALVHVNKPMVLSVDIKNFFNTIRQERVQSTLTWLLGQHPFVTYTPDDLRLLTALMCYREVLPQGAPTSPVMSNLCCISMDKQLKALAKAANCNTTRYADDIVVSGYVRDVTNMLNPIYRMLAVHMFRPNRRKTKFRRHFQRQQVTGIVVNKQTGVQKETWRNLRAALHNLKRDQQNITLAEYQKFRGQIEWIRSLNPPRGEQLLRALSLITIAG